MRLGLILALWGLALLCNLQQVHSSSSEVHLNGHVEKKDLSQSMEKENGGTEDADRNDKAMQPLTPPKQESPSHANVNSRIPVGAIVIKSKNSHHDKDIQVKGGKNGPRRMKKHRKNKKCKDGDEKCMMRKLKKERKMARKGKNMNNKREKNMKKNKEKNMKKARKSHKRKGRKDGRELKKKLKELKKKNAPKEEILAAKKKMKKDKQKTPKVACKGADDCAQGCCNMRKLATEGYCKIYTRTEGAKCHRDCECPEGLQCVRHKGKKGRCRGSENMAETNQKEENNDHANKVKAPDSNQDNHQVMPGQPLDPNEHKHSSKHDDKHVSDKEGHHHGDHQHGHHEKDSEVDPDQTLG